MKHTIEREKTYLAKYLPEGLEGFPHKEMLDFYVPRCSAHAKLRVRKSGDSYVITKKNPIDEKDPSIQIEQNIKITKEEFEALSRADANIVHKIRFEYPHRGNIAEIDVFLDKLAGLVLVDFEFTNKRELKNFQMPDFCLVDVTNEHDVAGGVLCQKTLADLNEKLKGYNYKKLCLKKGPIK